MGEDTTMTECKSRVLKHRCVGTTGVVPALELNTYQEQAAKTAIYPPESALEYLTLGLVGEAGEIANKVKKEIRGDYVDQHKTFLKELLVGELGDVLWYLAMLAKELDLSLEKVARNNIDKLASRQERGVLTGSGDVR
jgi:NTP pyrophosphatase (non-canonical NTP hydrolase)